MAYSSRPGFRADRRSWSRLWKRVFRDPPTERNRADAFTGDDPLLRHVRTRVRSPQTNGVAERFFGTLEHHLYRATIGDGNALAVEVN